MKVGIFDSGLGGLTILKSILQSLSEYDYVYLADSLRSPYGEQTFDTIFQWTLEAVDYLFTHQNCQVVILACNTASARALRTLQQTYLTKKYPNRRILGVVKPAVEFLAQHQYIQHLGIWATAGTVKSKSYDLEMQKLQSNIKITSVVCSEFVKFIEKNQEDLIQPLISKYWQETQNISPKISALFLACTHYPLIQTQIEKSIPNSVKVMNQVKIVTKRWQWYLNQHPEIETHFTRQSTCKLLTTQNKGFSEISEKILGKQVLVHEVKLPKVLL